MIQLPRRSVTRFFIPLIDVLTLLFCIFLLMPLIKPAGEGMEGDGTGSGLDRVDEVRTIPDKGLAELIRKERQELEEIRKQKMEALQQRLFIRVLEIDAETGRLYHQDGDQRVEVRDQDEALRLVDRHRREAGLREVYYLFLYPRRLTGFPQEGQIKQYEAWFKGVAHGMDNPRGRG